MPRDIVEIANPRRHGENFTSRKSALDLCARGQAYWLRDGRLRFRTIGRSTGDVYVDRRGAIWWNGSDSDGMHRPGEVVS